MKVSSIGTRSSRYLACAVMAALGAGSTAFADSLYDSVPSVHVRYGDLDLSTEQGSKILYHRITVAAQQVCERGADIRDLPARTRAEKCEADAISKAVNEVNSPQLAMVHASRTRRG